MSNLYISPEFLDNMASQIECPFSAIAGLIENAVDHRSEVTKIDISLKTYSRYIDLVDDEIEKNSEDASKEFKPVVFSGHTD
jgi:hypothetical protein